MAKGKSGFTVGKVVDFVSSGRDAVRRRDEEVTICVHVLEGAPRGLVLAVRDALVARRQGGIVEVMGPRMPETPHAPDACLVLCGTSGAQARGLALGYGRMGAPVGLVVESALEAPQVPTDGEGRPLADLVCASDEGAVAAVVGEWLADVSERPVALAANFPCARRPVVDDLISRCALENAALGTISLIPGSDFPVMTTREALLALDIALAYGAEVEPMRAVEVASVVVAGLALRSAGRAAAGAVPSLANLLKGAIAYGGTRLLGEALRLRFEGLPAAAPEGEAPTSLSPTVPGALPTPDGYLTIHPATA